MKKFFMTMIIATAILISGCASTGGFTTSINGVNTNRGSWCSRNVIPCMFAIGAGGAATYAIIKKGDDKKPVKKGRPPTGN